MPVKSKRKLTFSVFDLPDPAATAKYFGSIGHMLDDYESFWFSAESLEDRGIEFDEEFWAKINVGEEMKAEIIEFLEERPDGEIVFEA